MENKSSSIRHDRLREDLLRFQQSHGRGSWVLLEKLSGVPNATISRAASGKSRSDPETWEALHRAVPTEIRPPWDVHQGVVPLSTAKIEESLTISDQATIEHVRRVPVFNAQAGNDGLWTDAGYPVGEAAEYEYVAVSLLDANSFCVRIHGDSMSPTLEEGDVVLVNPSAPLVNGKICFARTPEGEAMVKRYREDKGTIILESDNRAHAPKVYTADNGKGLRIYRATRKIGEL